MEDLFNQIAEIVKPVNLLDHLQEKAVRSYYNTSFSPEKRGEQIIKDYSEELAADIEELRQDKNVSEESVTDYKTRYERFFSSYLGAKSNCFSVMITGGSNFNNYRHAKANRSEERHYEIFREWRLKAKKAIIRKSQPVKTFNSEIERYKADLAGMQANHEKMKAGNKLVAKAIKNNEDISQILINEYSISPHMVEWCMKFGFNLTNNNANMRRVEDRIKELEKKEQLRNESPVNKFTFDKGEILLNYEVDRIQVFFTVRPTRDELTEWKAKGLNSFNWSPSANAWQRKITPNAIWSTKRMFDNLKAAI